MKIERGIKCSKGWGFACKRRKRDQIPFLQERHPSKVYARSDDIKAITNSFLIQAQIAGSGKTWTLISLFNNETDIMLLPTHEALQNVLLTAKKQGVTISDDRIKVIANYFTEDETKITQKNQIKGLKKFKRILIDEIYQCNPKDLQKLYYAKMLYGVQLIGSGAFDQVGSPGNKLYDLKFNDFFKNGIFDGNTVVLNYLKQCGRFEDNLDELLVETIETGYIPLYFKDKRVSDLSDKSYYHLTVTLKERDKWAKYESKRYCDKLPSDQVAVYKDMHYGEGMEVQCTNNFSVPRGAEVKNKRVYTITHI